MESYRTKNGPRQRTVLNLGKLDLPQDQWKILADRIEQIVSGQALLFPIDETTEKLAQHYAQIIVHNGLLQVAAEDHLQITDFETVDLNSIKNTECRTIGVEHIGLSMCKTLGLDKLFKRLDFTPNQIQLAYLAIIGKIASPGSEKHTREWAQSISGLDELLGADFRHLPNNALYRISDLLLSHKDAIEKHLKMTEKTLFSLNEKIILYDLTNTYFEGRASSNSKAKRGRSKEKQKGCPLVTLGLIIDEFGFPKASKIFAGNVSEPKTLINMIEALYGEKIKESDTVKDKKGITILLDAGIATEDNLKLLKSQGYDYVCVARNKPVDPDIIDMDKLITIKADKSNKITVALVKKEGENILYCKSFAKANKEIAMKSLFEKRFEEGLSDICESISKKGGIKAYDKVLMRIGRLKGKYASIANYYRIEIVQKDGIVTKVTWNYEKKEKAEEKFSGTYFLRTSRADLDEAKLWSLYITLTNIEDTFRSLKSDLNLRPLYHQKEFRTDSHLFITLLAYHILNTIRVKLNQHDIYMRWHRIRDFLSTHIRITTSLKNKNDEIIYIRNTSVPEPFHIAVYNALGLQHLPLPPRRLSKKSVVTIK